MSDETITCEECGDEAPKSEATRQLGPGLGVEKWYCSTSCALNAARGALHE